MADWVHVIDDDDAVRDSLAFLLETADLSVRTYASAMEFLEAVPTMPHGCIVTDVRMPEMSGVELARRLKDLGVPDPVIVITGHADVPLAVEAMKASSPPSARRWNAVARTSKARPNARASPSVSPPFPDASARFWTAWWLVTPTRSSPTTSGSAPALSRSIAPMS